MKLPLAMLLASAFAGSAIAATDLLQVYRDAQGHDAQYAAARASRDAGLEKLPQGRAALLPTLGLVANTTWNERETHPRGNVLPSVSRDYNTNGWEVRLTQPLLNYASWVSYNQAELSVAATESQFAQAQMDLMVRSAQAYFDVLLAQETLATTQAQKAAFAEQLESAKRNFEVGTVTITDTHEAQARHDLAQAQEIAAENDLAVKRQALFTLTGKDMPALKALRAQVQILPPQPADMAKWVDMADSGAPTIQLAQANYEIASREVDKQRAGHYPTVNLVAATGKSAQSNYAFGGDTGLGGGADFDANRVGVELNLPIFAGGFTSSKQREAAALKEKAQADLENARRSAHLGVRQFFLGVTSGLAQVRAFDAALASSQLAVESNKLGYEVGVRINIDVLNAQGQLFDTRQKLAKARLDTLIAQLRLKAAAGNLSEDDLATINALLE